MNKSSLKRASMCEAEQLRDNWGGLCSVDRRIRAVALLSKGFTQRGLAKVLNIRESTLRYYLNLKQDEDNGCGLPAAGLTNVAANAAANPAATDPPAAHPVTTNHATSNPAGPNSAATDLSPTQQVEAEAARLDSLVREFASFLWRNWSLDPHNCRQLLTRVEARLNEAELARDLPKPLPIGTDARKVLAHIHPQPHTPYFEQVVFSVVVGLLYLGQNAEERRQILRGLVELFDSEIQRS